MLQLQKTDVVTWLAQASCRFLRQVPTTHQKMRELTNIYMMRKEERGMLNIFVVSILAPEKFSIPQKNLCNCIQKIKNKHGGADVAFFCFCVYYSQPSGETVCANCVTR